MRVVDTKISLMELDRGTVLVADLPGREGLTPVWVSEGPEERFTGSAERAEEIDGQHVFSTWDEAVEAVNAAGFIVRGERVARVAI